ncbi:uncharacterized protein LOC133533146 isoform X2 [Cydia pomonella]|uniref:uncharacterized protein LOC133533146 isoform X2 n=1 Tax=Cydia pomonella TaxID=82600 RepID=UPI002ADDEBC3|nr:uncharacterized protein LOC133533146 isoform X2 [Cydia pomonella]
MFKIIVLLLTTCLCAIGIYSETANDGFRISPDTYVDDGKQYMEFTCTAYLNEGDQLVWQRGSQSMVFYEKKYGSGFKTIKLTWPLQQSDNDTEIYCARNIKEKNGKFKWVQSKKIPIVFKTVKKTLTDTWGPWVWPVEHVMNNTTLIQLSCWAYLYKNQFVSWYQTSDKDTTERLSMIQQENEYSYVKLDLTKTLTLSDDGTNIFCANETFESDHSIKKITESEHIPLTYQTDTEPLDSNTRQRIETVQEDKKPGYKEIKLLKLLEPSDNNTQIYCAKETVSSSGSLKEGPRSQKISISIQREKPYVSVEPSRDIIIFKDDEKLSLICTGSKPVNNRQYTWYIEGESQKYSLIYIILFSFFFYK